MAHYDGCVNIGVPDTLLLRVENADARLLYHWKIPAEWEPIGDTNRGELRVITHETKDTTRIYGVRFASDRVDWTFDTVQVRGADTTLYMMLMKSAQLFVSTPQGKLVSTHFFDLWWYKGDFSEENRVINSSYISLSPFGGLRPLLKYRLKGSDACWSATDKVITPNSLQVEIVGDGKIRVYSGGLYNDVTTEGKHKVLVGYSDTLRFVVKPSDGFYLDRIEIEENKQVAIVSEEEIKRNTDGTFTFYSTVTWQGAASTDSISKENFRFIFTEKQHIIKDLGEHTVCWGDSVKMRDYYVRQPGWHYDTVDGEKVKGDTVYSLYLHVNPTYRDTLYFLAERD
ncbi:MAG: hypothetical protein K2J57_03285, partial [Bacteroidales bacterium]|nr:hypothetical protein [Bacteroidales bacterium]